MKIKLADIVHGSPKSQWTQSYSKTSPVIITDKGTDVVAEIARIYIYPLLFETQTHGSYGRDSHWLGVA